MRFVPILNVLIVLAFAGAVGGCAQPGPRCTTNHATNLTECR
jgi:hypothetical protein